VLEILRACCLGLSPVISTQFTLELCVAAWNCEQFTKAHILRFKVVQGHRCWYPGKLDSSACYEATNMYLSATVLMVDEPMVVNSDFLGGPFLMPSFEGNGNLITRWHKIWSQQTRDSTLSYSENPVSLSQLCLNRCRMWQTPGRTDGRTDRITIAIVCGVYVFFLKLSLLWQLPFRLSPVQCTALG